MSAIEHGKPLEVVEICAGAGGQSLGLERAGFRHRLAIELDHQAAETLRCNLVEFLGYSEKEAQDSVRVGDVADPAVWNPVLDAEKVDLLAGECPARPSASQGSSWARAMNVICSLGQSSSAARCSRRRSYWRMCEDSAPTASPVTASTCSTGSKSTGTSQSGSSSRRTTSVSPSCVRASYWLRSSRSSLPTSSGRSVGPGAPCR